MSIDVLGNEFRELSVATERPRKQRRDWDGVLGFSSERVSSVAQAAMSAFLPEEGPSLKGLRLEVGSTCVGVLPRKKLTKNF